MDKYTVFPDVPILENGVISKKFLSIGINTFHEACRYVHELPYGYNSNSDGILILFKENKGTCTTKHAVIGMLSEELKIPIFKHVGVYEMSEEIVTGADTIIKKYGLPYIPMIHCFLVYEKYRVDLTEGNNNGKNKPIDEFLYSEKVKSDLPEKEEYTIYKKALKEIVLKRKEVYNIQIRQILKARQEGLALLRSKVLLKNSEIL